MQVLCSSHQVLLLCAQALDKSGFWKAALPYIQALCAEGHNLQLSERQTKVPVSGNIWGCTFEALNHYTSMCPFVASAPLCWCTLSTFGTCRHDFLRLPHVTHANRLQLTLAANRQSVYEWLTFAFVIVVYESHFSCAVLYTTCKYPGLAFKCKWESWQFMGKLASALAIKSLIWTYSQL